ncbi:MAG TPA: ATP-dependent helicase HrpB [Planctomycetales bacterium]|nr:ATP-dependent helicase HrpB [Planctomycetales bacterium]
MVPLPIDLILPDIVAALRRGPCVVVRAPTGAGKTTRVPPALLDAGIAANRRILVLEPRRVAARAAARRMALERGGRLGDEVGYQVRFDRQYGPRTRILVITPGVLLRLLQDDPFLESAGVVVFDEFHERGLDSDLALGMVRLLQQTVRPDLRVVVMSATVAVEQLSAYLGDCPVASSEGRQYPVEVRYEPRPEHQSWPAAAALAAERLLDQTDGDLLVFLPGMQEIRQTARHLEDAAAKRKLAVLPLHGDLPAEQQDAALAPWDRRKIVLATKRGGNVDHGRRRRQRLGAVDAQGATELGRTLARLPVHPRLARLLVEGPRWGRPERAALTAALLAERDPFARDVALPFRVAAKHLGHGAVSDVLDRVEALEEFARTGRIDSPLGTLNRGAARFTLRARDQLLRSLRYEIRGSELSENRAADEAVLRPLLAAFPDRLARRREAGSRRGVMVGGRGVRLAPTSGVTESELFLCIDVDASRTETLVRQASAVQREWLPPERLTSAIEVAFDAATERVSARRRVRFEDLVLEEAHTALPDDAETAGVLTAAALKQLDRVLPPADSPAGLYRTRVRWLREWMPELELPPFDENDLRDLLSWLCVGRRSFADLRAADWLSALQGRLTHIQRQAVEREAPERLPVPSGSRITLRYEPGRAPVLAARIQEMFGLQDTPRVAGGRVRVVLHLLAPNHRPQQVTDDLASFWSNTYPQIRKELRGRYPKHAWPEDPWTAPAERRPRRKK